MAESASKLDGTWIDHLGHTSFAVTRGARRILIDPILVREDLDFRRPTVPRWFFGDTSHFDAVFISHGHNDHLHPPSLLGLPAETPIYFLAEDPASCSCREDEDPYRLLPSLGFRDLRPFRAGDRIDLGEGLTIEIVPASASSEGEEQCCFLIETPDAVVLDAVDIKDDPQTREALAGRRGQVDLAFVPTGAALQFQGFWNQMDAVEALGFCRWLSPARVASCGGALSLSERPRPDTLERYPHDLADWIALAGVALEPGKLLALRPPFRLHFRERELRRASPMLTADRFEPRNGSRRPQAVLTPFFTGYHPRFPTRRLLWPDDGLETWLEGLSEIRDVVRNSEAELGELLRRCSLAINHTPAARLAPSTLRRLTETEAYGLAARISAHIPPAPEDPMDLDLSFFAVLEALVENARSLPDGLRGELAACVWIDRRMFLLWSLYLRLRGLATYSPEQEEVLLEQHIRGLRASAALRRPVLGSHHFRLDRGQIPLLTGRQPKPQTAQLLCYASPRGIHQRPLNAIEARLLDLCDGREFGEIVGELAQGLGLPADEVEEAAFNCLSQFSRDSILLIDWSRS